jgi:peptidoglycan/xylan/chitin deacetylase (PgdA/CDA1 family)
MKAISIMYHDVVAHGRWDESGFPGADAALYKLEREEFARHLHAIARAIQHPPITVFELAATIARRAMPLLITFDDGGVSAYTHIAAMLEEYGWRGHFFVTANHIGTPTFLSRAQIRELRARGHVIGSHSSSHPLRFANCSWDEMLHEWQTSVETLSEIIGEAVTTASVPGGYYSRKVAEAASQAGIERLFNSEPTATCIEVAGCLILGRYTVQRWTTATAAAALAGGRLAPRLRQLALWQAKKVTKAIGGEQYLKVRRSLVGNG